MCICANANVCTLGTVLGIRKRYACVLLFEDVWSKLIAAQVSVYIEGARCGLARNISVGCVRILRCAS